MMKISPVIRTLEILAKICIHPWPHPLLPVLNTQRAARLLPLESPARRCSGSKFSARRGVPSKGEVRAIHHQPCPSLHPSPLRQPLTGSRPSTRWCQASALCEQPPPARAIHEVHLWLLTVAVTALDSTATPAQPPLAQHSSPGIGLKASKMCDQDQGRSRHQAT